MAQNLTNQDWRSLAAQASTEQDSARLTSLGGRTVPFVR